MEMMTLNFVTVAKSASNNVPTIFNQRNKMSHTINCKLVISESGKVMQLHHENGRLIAEVLIHGPLLETAQNCTDRKPLLKGRPNVYRAECFGLAGYEFLDMSNECIKEK